MTQYKIINKFGREVFYGADKPTGGFFFTEFYLDDEMPKDGFSDVVVSESSLTIHELMDKMFSESFYILSDREMNQLIQDWLNSTEPTPLQKNVSLMFGKDLDAMIERVDLDLQDALN